MLEAGFEKVVVTPPPGVPLAGFAARTEVSTGAHDDLFARSLVLADGGSAVAILSVDVLALPADSVCRVRERIAAETPIAPSSVLIASTHTHAAPNTIATFFNPGETVDPAYMRLLEDAMVAATAAAYRNRAAALAGTGAGRIESLGVNRRTPDGKPVDEEIGLIRIDDPDGRTRAVLVNYACHPTVLGPNNLLVTADFPASLVGSIEAALGPGSFAMYVNGTQGNIGPGHSSELSAIGVIAPGRTFERAAELGNRIGEAVLQALGSIQCAGSLALCGAAIEVELPLKRFPAPKAAALRLRQAEEAVARLEEADPAIRQAKTELLYASIENYYSQETAGTGGGLRVELQGIRVGNTAWIGLPAEVFVEIGLRIKRAAARRVFLAGVANGYIGYLPDRNSYPAGGYEVVSAQVGEDTEDRLVEGVLELERRLFPA